MGSILSALVGDSAAAGDSLSGDHSGVQTFHSSERWQLHFNSIKDSSQLMVVDFAASWCGPCKFMEPEIKSMATKYSDVQFSKIDVDELPGVAQEFGVQAMPTFVLVKKGKEVDRVVGAKKDELLKKIEKHRAA
ncbi:thioredoxin H2 [Ricinus communis]|uniref:Thioredoxin H-type, putative n=1 Tax=Ricinus communis TaxID=3988 RepID=B9RUL3_RICCO|nr:thioredoxin H2 [Ricinus communis]EEF45000.1 Thioredoxin H-type, putative [Ricinus communis]|eukprot:XP_002517458.1 thioredoxin H2 [Ricinus communis]